MGLTKKKHTSKLFLEDYKYQAPLDAIYLLSTDKKLEYFFQFMAEDLKSYARRFQNGEIEMMPLIHFQAGAASSEFLAIDYAYLVEVMAKMVNYNYEMGGAALIADYAVDTDSKINKSNALMLIHGYFSQCLGIAYVNTMDNKTVAKYLRFSSKSVFANKKVAAEFSAVSFVIKQLNSYFTTDVNLMSKLISFGDLSGAEQVAYGTKAADYFKERKIKQTYYMTTSQISNQPTFE